MVEFKAKRQLSKQILTVSAEGQGLDGADEVGINLELRPAVDSWLVDSALEHLKEIVRTPLTFHLSTETRVDLVSRRKKAKTGGKK